MCLYCQMLNGESLVSNVIKFSYYTWKDQSWNFNLDFLKSSSQFYWRSKNWKYLIIDHCTFIGLLTIYNAVLPDWAEIISSLNDLTMTTQRGVWRNTYHMYEICVGQGSDASYLDGLGAFQDNLKDGENNANVRQYLDLLDWYKIQI